MAAELRYIVLSNGEVESGIQAYRRMNSDFLPAGDITSWTVNDDQTMTIEMDVKGGSTVNHVTFTVDGDEVTAILVRFCIENNIVVPRAGRKDWHLQGGKVTLRIRLNDKELTTAYDEMETVS